MSSSSYKITVKQVREAAKKTGIEIDKGSYYVENLDGKIACACPLGQLYAASHPNLDLYDAYECSQWAVKKFGKYFRDGFTMGFDNNGKFCGSLKGKNLENWLNGYRNGKNLRKYLLNE